MTEIRKGRVWEQGEDGLVSREPDHSDRQQRAAMQIGFPTDRAMLPETYERARQALAECVRVDECVDWSDKAYALQVYARQVHDETLLHMAMRIRLRAMRRAGQLLSQYDARGAHRSQEKSDAPQQKDVALAAGLKMTTARNAIRVANIDEAEFEQQVEQTRPPTINAISVLGRQRKQQPKGPQEPATKDRPRWPEHDALVELRDAAATFLRNKPASTGRRLRSALAALGPLYQSEQNDE